MFVISCFLASVESTQDILFVGLCLENVIPPSFAVRRKVSTEVCLWLLVERL